ncbi:hypothetical protein BDV98DRAFT_220001 [Pterulicium gracile]|uniref:RlpA-like double-psi beta-barrel-protein domain-containing protein-containing protein n=1 Tax=Pterulicium gracile TaxID=1884261 RepID=A0A5C3Q8L4_9AGAR|nr:hypothetical protein BDV98DRAFT_220001 [Pterula gracilis]
MKFLLTLAALVTTALAASVAKPPPSVLSYSGPPTKEMHQIREEALADLKNGTQHLVARDSFGSGTWYDVNAGYTACGTLHNNDAWVVAVSAGLYDSTAVDGNPNHNRICGRKIWLWGWYGTAPTDVTIVDRCAGCAWNDIDMSPSVFRYVVGDLGAGRKPIGWNWA